MNPGDKGYRFWKRMQETGELDVTVLASSKPPEDKTRYQLSRSEVAVILTGLSCQHLRMRYCCDHDCGHLTCPDCGLYYDEQDYEY